MTQVIWKFPLPLTDRPIIQMPKGARWLTVQMQGGQPMLWAVVDPEAELCPYAFRVLGTGQATTEQLLAYVGTVQQGPFVWHVFEATP